MLLSRDYHLEGLRQAYFSNPAYRILLEPGDVLIRQGEPNDRLFLLLSGRLTAKMQRSTGRLYDLYSIEAPRFVGVYSFFSETYRSFMAVVAEEACELAFMDAARFRDLKRLEKNLFELFMPVVVTELVNRLQQTQELTLERERTFDKLLQSEKMASLGQMAAGIAHELNNAIAVLERNSAWLRESLADSFETPELNALYRKGVSEGLQFSSRELRARSRRFQDHPGLDTQSAWLAAEAGLSEQDLQRTGKAPQLVAGRHRAWKIGTALRDMQVAARQAAHVVRSVRNLGTPHARRGTGVDLNETLRDALVLLQSSLRQVQVNCSFGVLPAVSANAGELVQIWTNLIRNACESFSQANMTDREVRISSAVADRGIRVCIEDNGPGIPKDILPFIFQPNVTTKIGGLSFGLGLGLTIVFQLVQGYGGTIDVDSRPGHTSFCVNLPVENDL